MPDVPTVLKRLPCDDYEPADFDPAALRARILTDRHGFVTQEELAQFAGHDVARLFQCLVRCGGCRFVCAAQDVAVLIHAIELAGDYVRDVAILPAGGR